MPILKKLNRPHILIRYNERQQIEERRILPTYGNAIIRVGKLPPDASIIIVQVDGTVRYKQGNSLPRNVKAAAEHAARWYSASARRIAALKLMRQLRRQGKLK